VFDDLAAGGARVKAAVGSAAANRLARPESRAAWELNCQVMRMHRDLELGFDSSSAIGTGPGALPLDAAAVSAAFRAHQLTWTTPAALQFLAYEDPPERPVEHAWSTGRDDPAGAERRPASATGRSRPARPFAEQGRTGRRHGRLAKHAPQPADAAVQLSLFD
jgi:hypothetical protein